MKRVQSAIKWVWKPSVTRPIALFADLPRITLLVAIYLSAGILTSAIARAADDAETVGEWGDSDRIEITGESQLSSKFLLAAITADVKTQSAACADSPLLDYLDALRHRIITTYEHCGFPAAQVACRRDSLHDKIVVRIDEGPCCDCDSVQVEGAKRIPISELVRQCREQRPPSDAILSSFDLIDEKTIPHWVNRDGDDVSPDDSIWAKGKEARFDAPSKSVYERKVARCFADLGFPAAEFDIEIRPDAANKTAALVIRIAKEGPGPIIQSVDVVGNKVNSTKAILDFAGIRVGTAYSAERAADWQQRLWRSGRFVRHEISAHPGDDDTSGLTLRVEVVEMKKAPAIDAPLSTEEATMLKCRDWLAGFLRRGEDLVVTLPPTDGDRVPIVVISAGGMVATLNELTPNPDGSPRVRHAVVLRPESMGYYSFLGRTRFVAHPDSDLGLLCTIELKLKGDVDQQETLAVGLGCRNISGDSIKLPLKFALGGTPAAFLHMANQDDWKVTIQDGMLNRQKGEQVWQIDMKTGQFRVSTKSDDHTLLPGLTFERGAFDRMRRQIETSAADFPNRYDPHRPVSTTMALLMDSDLQKSFAGKSAPDSKTLAVMQKLLAGGALQPLDEGLFEVISGAMIAPLLDSRSDEFDWAGMYPAGLLAVSDSLGAHGTWPWSGTRAMAFYLARDNVGEHQLAQLIKSAQAGPLSHLYLVAMANTFDWEASRVFARHGLDRMALADFRNDYRPLLSQRSLLGKQILALASALRRLSPDEVDALCKGLPPDDARLLHEAVTELRASGNAPLEDVLPKVLDHAWENGLRAYVEKALLAKCRSPLDVGLSRP